MTECKTPKLKLLGWRVICRIDNARMTAGGIEIPELSEPNKRRGVVVGVGDGRVNDTDKILPFPVDIGDCVLLGPYAHQEYEEDGNLYVICATQDILAVIDPVPA